MNNLNLLPIPFVASYVFILGLCVGSFLNVVILRGLSGESIVFGRSHCPKCNKQLKWYMNIPLFSYIFLKGKCAYCKTKISIQYPIVEFLCGICFLLSYFIFGLTLKTLFFFVFFFFFIALSTTDILETVIIDIHAYLLCLFALLYSLLGLNNIDIVQSIIGAIFGFLIFEILARFGTLITKCRMFGEGDSLIALGLGAIFGYKNLIIVIGLSILLQSLSAIPMLIKKSILDKKIKLAISYLTILISMILLALLNYFSIINYSLIYFISVSIIILSLLWSLKNILAEIKSKNENDEIPAESKFNLVPFGPALIVSAVICLFFIQNIKDLILDFIY